MSVPRRISFLIFVDHKPVSTCMSRDAESALACAREWAGEVLSLPISVLPETDCTPEQIARYNASETARCAEWGSLAKCVPFGADLAILAERLDPAPSTVD